MFLKDIAARTAALGMAGALSIGTLCGCFAEQPQDGSSPVEEPARSPADVSFDVDGYTPPEGEVAPEHVAGLAETTLSEAEKERLVSGLTNYFKDDGDMSSARFSVEEKSGGEDGKLLTVTDEQTGKKYELLMGQNWNMREIGKEEERSAKEHERESEEIAAAGQDQTSEYHSANTDFDVRSAWPLSMTDKVGELVGKKIAKRLLADLNEYMAEGNVRVDDPVNILVSEDGIERDGDLVTFTVMAYSGMDRIVMTCQYNVKTMEHAFTWMP